MYTVEYLNTFHFCSTLFFLLLFTALQTKLGHDIVALYLLFLCSDVITGRQYHVISEAFMRAGRDLIFES